MAEGTSASRLVRIDDLRRCLEDGLARLRVTHEHAEAIAGLLVDSELRGHEDHGAAMLDFLANLYRNGTLNPRPEIRVLSETEGALLLDGDNGCGVVAATRAMRWCIERARALRGMAVAGVRNSQFLTTAPYTRLAAEAGMIGFACTNATPMVAPPGGRTRVLGTNPLGYAIPAGTYPPTIFDMATTNSAARKVVLAAQEDYPTREGIVLDRSGRPTTDPHEFLEGGFMAPLGYPHAAHKGFGLAVFVDMLGGILTGAGFAQVPGGPGNALWALDVEAFVPREEFLARVDQQIAQIKAAERGKGVDEILLPGERGHRRALELTARGTVPLSPAAWNALAHACQPLGVPLPPVLT